MDTSFYYNKYILKENYDYQDVLFIVTILIKIELKMEILYFFILF